MRSIVFVSQHVFVPIFMDLSLCPFYDASKLTTVKAGEVRPVLTFSLALSLSLVINHNLFAWLLPCCSGSLSTVCPCVPSGVCIHVGEDYGSVIVAYFYAKQIFPHRVCTWENGDIEQKSGGKWDRQIVLKGEGFSVWVFCILWSCDRAGGQ